jgi:hypothetical protein
MATAEKKGQQPALQLPFGYYQDIPSIDRRVLQKVWEEWEPERPELLVRLRPRRTLYAAE